MKPKSGNRFRVCGTPSKTGCITCKIRRVKCGEEKPFCKRCTSTGRKCDGYAPPKTPEPTLSRSPSRCLSSSPEMDPMEQRLLYFFRTFTAPKLSGYFSADFWQRRVLQASDVEPSIRHAVIAIAAIHQDYVSWHKNGVFDTSIQSFSFRQYTKAISHLHRLMSTQTQQLDMTLMSCITFITFDCLLGNHESAIIHLRAGLKILEDIKQQKSAGGAQNEWETEFAPLLLSLGTQAASFVNPRHQTDRFALWIALRNAGISNRSNTFRSLDEARHALNTLAADITVERTSPNRSFGRRISDVSPVSNTRHMAAIQAWTAGLDSFQTESYATDISTSNKINLGVSLLKIYSIIYTITIDADERPQRFEDVLAHGEFIVDSKILSPAAGENLSFTADMGLISPLFFVILKAPNEDIRQRASELLARAPGREGKWNADDALRIAGDIMDEARGLQSPGFPPGSSPASMSSAQTQAAMGDQMIWPFGEKCEYTGTAQEPYSPLTPLLTPFSMQGSFSQLPTRQNSYASQCSINSQDSWHQDVRRQNSYTSQDSFQLQPAPRQTHLTVPGESNFECFIQPDLDWISFPV
ncbi:hypothetical protein BGZ60DRAFT_522622 [Tricladium varicosporioides]|nr:hypothetical protein BGZ60DRAFT_522622 [Hymenoscyphus varicosporioides]